MIFCTSPRTGKIFGKTPRPDQRRAEDAPLSLSSKSLLTELSAYFEGILGSQHSILRLVFFSPWSIHNSAFHISPFSGLIAIFTITQMALQQHQLLPAEIQGERACSQSSISTQSVQACVQCRRQHLKCDAVVPVCTRCQSTGEECRYVKSKRGGKRIRKPAEQETRPDSMPNTAQVSLDPWNRPFIEPNSHVHLVTQATSVRSTADADNIHHRSDCCPSLIRIPASHISFQSRSPFHNQLPEYIRSYYDSFHDAHPYVLPQACLMKRLERDDAKEMESLVTAIGFIGLCYSSPAKAESAIVATTSLLLENELPKTGFTVQALLLFSLALTFYSKRDRGRSALSIAVDLALELGMNWDSYATVYGEGCPVLQESWRRTWWGLYITDATLAANHNATTFKLWGVATDVSLPCEEIDYSRGVSQPAPVIDLL